ncbi:MAG TPA: hypothetical protein DEF47_12420 [Herpetosiphon sp.]|uniref:DNA methylase adenine-specific domain-containing protein n=1 Tax=Herpetosiphon aurantiacus (strain ATCC 23779 / DSM 785 / 114-95) TaxID=316274 RepID=A9AVB4_HERA2|nr:N-6 DNA methylase [Herpetosiphon sp.]ABX03192.1 conserved hypothetical protein [Herpetosiphon aurantiacus DSM 785]HBW50699.1 hypothetical protein [Herpetosiphon sp.]
MYAQRVANFVQEYQRYINNSANEEELRSGFYLAATNALGIPNFTLERGRQDIRRNRVILEFKNKGLFRGQSTSLKFKEAQDQLINRYIPQQSLRDGRRPSDYIGVCFDGEHLAFTFVEPDQTVRVTKLLPFDEHSAGALVMALDVDDRRELTPQNVIDDFGPSSFIARQTLQALWHHLNVSLDMGVKRIHMLFTEWKSLFQQGTSIGTRGRQKLQAYLQSVGLPESADITRLLFVLHTYHALFFKLLAAEVVLTNAIIPGMTQTDFCFSTAGLPDRSLIKLLVDDIEESKVFRRVNILNFVEGTFFTWYTHEAPAGLIEAIRQIMQRLNLYRLSDLQLERTRDIVKYVYEQIVPEPLRHSLGEYFTPEWLVEFTLDRVGYQGSQILDQKILDPCCGSGNFLIHAIERYKQAAHAQGWDDSAILHGITNHIFGFDLNPLAMLTARVNYLIAISDLLKTSSAVEIPVYQADAVYIPKPRPDDPTIYRYDISTRLTGCPILALDIPVSLIHKQHLFARVLEEMEESINEHQHTSAFITHLKRNPEFCRVEDHLDWIPYLEKMFNDIQFLESRSWNRIWCRIARNYFASVAIGSCDIVAGNPPWVRWSELPQLYAEKIKPICDEYGIFSDERFFGGNELDISGMITYTVIDQWLDEGGKLAFILPQNHLQSQSSGGFRQFQIRETPLEVLQVDDFSEVKPFRRVGNRPAVITIYKGRATTYPVPYNIWKRITPTTISENVSYATAAENLLSIPHEAYALEDAGKRWSILPLGRFPLLSMLNGEDRSIEGRKGIVTDLNGAYFIRILGHGYRTGTLRFKTSPDQGQKPVPERTYEIEADLVYPLIKGAKNVQPFYATTSELAVIVPNKGINSSSMPSMSRLTYQGYPLAARYFQSLNRDVLIDGVGLLDQRSTWRTRMRPFLEKQYADNLADIPFYAIYNVGDYTFAPYKVVWAEMSGSLKAAVISDGLVPYIEQRKIIIPDHKIYFASFSSEKYAHFICALLNSSIIREFVDSFTIKLQVGTIFKHLRLPKFDLENAEHLSLVDLSITAHNTMNKTNGSGNIEAFIEQIDIIAVRLLAKFAATITDQLQQEGFNLEF